MKWMIRFKTVPKDCCYMLISRPSSVPRGQTMNNRNCQTIGSCRVYCDRSSRSSRVVLMNIRTCRKTWSWFTSIYQKWIQKPKIWMILIWYTSFYVYGFWAKFSTKEKKISSYLGKRNLLHVQLLLIYTLLIDVTRTNKAQLKLSSVYLQNWSFFNNLFSWHFYLVNTFYLSYVKAKPHSLTD